MARLRFVIRHDCQRREAFSRVAYVISAGPRAFGQFQPYCGTVHLIALQWTAIWAV
jgi:hypothetical protein